MQKTIDACPLCGSTNLSITDESVIGGSSFCRDCYYMFFTDAAQDVRMLKRRISQIERSFDDAIAASLISLARHEWDTMETHKRCILWIESGVCSRATAQ